MRARLAALGMSALMLAAPVSGLAAPRLKAVMRAWRSDARDASDMLSGRAAFDAAAVGAAFQTYAVDARSIASEVRGQSAGARDFRQRFVAFQADARTGLGHLSGHLSDRGTLKADFARLMDDCQSCHHKFNN